VFRHAKHPVPFLWIPATLRYSTVLRASVDGGTVGRNFNRCPDAAGIADPELRRSFELCRGLHAHYGRSKYLATRLFPPAKRPFVHSLYGFARHPNEIVDNGPPATKAQALTEHLERGRIGRSAPRAQ
jgi:hypothetical protein